MFQCMARVRDVFDLRALYRTLQASGHDVTARSPGSLGQTVPNLEQWQVGSLSAKINGFSVFVFQNQKVKISGGSKGFYESGESNYERWMDQHVVSMVMSVLRSDCVEWKLSLLNGSQTLSNVDASNYMRVCEGLKTTRTFVRVIPPSMFTAPSKRGRICSVCLKCATGGSIRFDHSGKAQMFAFRSLEDMNESVQHLIEILRNFT